MEKEELEKRVEELEKRLETLELRIEKEKRDQRVKARKGER